MKNIVSINITGKDTFEYTIQPVGINYGAIQIRN
jgi:hypothetical protein